MVPMDCPTKDTEDTDSPNMFAPLKNKVDDYINFSASAHAPHVEKET
jgi:hypothetical protein